MATTVTWYVDPDAVGAGTGVDWTNAYTSLHAAQTAKAKNLTLSDEIYVFECRSSGGTADTTRCLMSNTWVCDSTRYVVLKATAGHEALKTGWDATRYRISLTDSETLSSSNTKLGIFYVQGLQLERIYSSVTYGNVVSVYNAGAGSIWYYSSIRIRLNNNTTAGLINGHDNATIYIYDSVIEGTSRFCLYINKGVAYAYNSVFQNAATDGVNISAGKTLVIKNCAVFNNTDDFQDDSGGTAVIDYCASDDGDGGHAIAPSGGNWANEFTDYTTGNYTLKTSGNLYQHGVDDPGAGLYSTDMEGNLWVSPWSIGIDQYVASGADYPSFLTMDMKNRLGNLF